MKIEYTPVHELQPYSNNARTHSKKQLRQIANSKDSRATALQGRIRTGDHAVSIEIYHVLERELCRVPNIEKEKPMTAEARLKELGLVLPVLPKPVANYLPYRLAGNLLFLAGQGPRDEKGAALTGKLGAEISIEEGYQRARLVGLGLLAAMRDALGSLDRVDFIVKLLGMVNAVPNFNDSPKVINGCSDLFVEVFGDAGRHARSAVGNVMLPNQISVEIEGIVAVKA
jgi:enamine deaminase RidA (YjgF/YER057c/UK114 family)